MSDDLTVRLAGRLKQLRQDRGWSLEQLAEKSGVSRASLSRLEKADVSPTTEVLGRLCAAYGLTQSRLLAMVEEGFEALIPAVAQAVWQDEEAGFTRRIVSPPALSLMGEVIHCDLAPAAQISYAEPSVEGLEHHLIMLAGRLSLKTGDSTYLLSVGDCLRYCLRGATEFIAGETEGARYMLVQIGGGQAGGLYGRV